jgi:hypothetical protein
MLLNKKGNTIRGKIHGRIGEKIEKRRCSHTLFAQEKPRK